MANKRIDQLPASGNVIKGTDIFPTFSDGKTERNTIDELVSYSGFSSVDTYVTGTTLNVNSLELGRNQGLSTLTVDLSSLITSNDTYITGSTLNVNSLELSRNQGLSDVTVDLTPLVFTASFGNTYFVAPEGDDTTGVRGNISKPFKTISGGRNKVADEISANTVTGTTLVYVYPGEYIDEEMQYDNGNFYFSPGAKVTSIERPGSGTTSMFVVGSAPTFTSASYSANTCNVFGSGEFVLKESTDGGWGGRIIDIVQSGSGYFECYQMTVEQGIGVRVLDNGQATFRGVFIDVGDGYVSTVRDYGDAVFNFNRISVDTGGWPFLIRAGNTAGFYGKCVIDAEEISVGASALREAIYIQTLQEGAEVIVNADKITSNGDYVITANANVGGDIIVNGKLFGLRALKTSNCTGGNITINGDGEFSEGGIDMLSTTSVGYNVTYDGHMTILSGATDGIDLDGGTLNLHGSLTNKDISGNGTTYNGIDVTGVGVLEINNFSIFTDNESIIGSNPARTVTYDITSAELPPTEIIGFCAIDPSELEYNITPLTFSWTSTGSITPSSVSVSFYESYNDYTDLTGNPVDIYLNGTLDGNYSSSSVCEPITGTTSLTPSNYNVGSTNTWLYDYEPDVGAAIVVWQENLGWGSGIYARVTVDYPITPIGIHGSLYVDRPINTGTTTSGQYTYTGTTYLGDLSIYNTPIVNSGLTDILGRNSSTGNVESMNITTLQTLLTTKVSMTASDLISGTSVTAIAAPGAGFVIEVISAAFDYTYGGVSYDVGKHIQVITDTAATSQYITPQTINGLLKGASSTFVKGVSVQNDTISLVDNKSLTVKSNGVSTVGNGTCVVYITYKIITL